MSTLKRYTSITRWRKEIFSPSRNVTRVALDFIHRIGSGKISTSIAEWEKAVFIWDWRVSPITYDFVWYLFYARYQIQKYGFERFDIILFTPDFPEENNSGGYASFVSSAEVANRVKTMIIPIAQLHGGIESIFRFSCPVELSKFLKERKYYIFPDYFSGTYSPNAIQSYARVYPLLSKLSTFRSEQKVILVKGLKRNLDEAKEDRVSDHSEEQAHTRYVTLTLRDYGYAPTRNTSQLDIEKATEFSKELGATLVIIPDSYDYLSRLHFADDSTICFQARESLHERVRLYGSSLVNLFPPCGPGQLSLFVKGSKTIFFNHGCGGHDGNYGYYSKLRLFPQQQHFLRLSGYIIWSNRKDEYSVGDLIDGYQGCSLG